MEKFISIDVSSRPALANVWKARIRLVLEMLIIYAQNSFLCSAHFVGVCGPRNHRGFTVCCQTFEDRGSLFIIRLATKALLTLTDVLRFPSLVFGMK